MANVAVKKMVLELLKQDIMLPSKIHNRIKDNIDKLPDDALVEILLTLQGGNSKQSEVIGKICSDDPTFLQGFKIFLSKQIK